MTARLLRPDGTIHREWQTDRPELALSAARNFPPGWRVQLCDQRKDGGADAEAD